MHLRRMFISFLLSSLFITITSTSKAEAYKDTSVNKIYFFLATSCPISQQYTKEIKRLDSLYSGNHVEMILVFSTDGKNSIKKEVKHFTTKFGLTMPVFIDKNFKLTKELNATVTPEAFLTDQHNKILYHGAIDNWYYALGKNRLEITSHYLEDAILAAMDGKPIFRTYIAPVGCFIETK